MLRSVYLKNYALVDELSIELASGLSIITGETGAGKSIIVGAINLLLGGRSSSDSVRAGASKAIVEAEFDITAASEITAFLRLNEIEQSPTLIIRREIGSQGSSRAFINDSPATLQLLKGLGALLVDLHGQHDHQSLLYPERHRIFLDAFAGLDADLATYSNLYAQYIRLRNELQRLEGVQAEWARQRDFYEFQFKEISAVAPTEGEDDQIEAELGVREHAEELIAASSSLHALLYEADDAVYAKLSQAKTILERIAKLDPSLEDALREVNSSLVSSRELGSMLSGYAEKIEYDPARLNELRERQVALTRLKKKYGPSLGEVIATFTRLEKQLDPENDVDEQILQSSNELARVRIDMSKRAQKLSASRQTASKKLEKAIRAALQELGMENAVFEVRFDKEAAPEGNESKVYVRTDDGAYVSYPWGIDKIEFYLSTNKGEQPKPLARIASGGEVSRIMLALKSALSSIDQIPTLIFDEIDTGISGRIAQKVGKAMKLLGKQHQVISITHLGQIAAFADHHYVVEKRSVKQSTQTSIRLLDEAEHHQEIARLLAGETVSKESLEAAKALKKEADELA